jgi:aldehyde:ferredoxin oxidoreductase
MAAEDLGPARRIAKASYAACTIGFVHITSVGRAPNGVRLEYESLFALGPFCGIDDPEMILLSARACDDAGLDTISTGEPSPS